MTIIKLTFELDQTDLDHLSKLLHRASEAAERMSDKEIVAAAEKLVRTVRGSDVSSYVRQRAELLAKMVAMVEDHEWNLLKEDAARVTTALTYFVEPEDLIPDDVPVFGYLDDAVMIELIARELRHELDAYEDFCAFRDAEIERHQGEDAPPDVKREDWLAAKRAELHARMRRRRKASRWRSLLPRRLRRA